MAEDTVAILGGKGMLGTDLASECTKQGINFEVFDLPEFDITNEQHLGKAIRDAKAVINCAAYTDVERAESEANPAYQVNGVAVGRLGALAREDNIWVLHISTDFVFDGKCDRPYLETDSPNPINAFGSKVNNRIYPVLPDDFFYQGPIANVALDKFVVRVVFKASEVFKIAGIG